MQHAAMKKTMIQCLFMLGTLSSAFGEKPIRGRPFSQPLFLRQEEAPYPPSGWKPDGQRLVLPARQEAGVPHTVYGPPSSEAPPATEPPQYPPNNEYGPPQEPQDPNNAYGGPVPVPGEDTSETLEPQQPGAGGYAPVEAGPSGYEYSPPVRPFPDPTNQYGPPPPQSQPDNGYAPGEYGVPAPPQQAQPEPDNGYGPPPQETGQIPVDQGAAERLRQQQFVQQLPGFGSSRFIKPQSQRFRQQAPQSQRKQPVLLRNQQQLFRQRTQQFQRQQQQQNRAQGQEYAQKQQLYQTPQTEQDETQNPNVAVATAVSGQYYVVEPNGRLQRVSYTTKNGKLLNGKITSGIKAEEIRNTKSAIYQVNEFNQLIKINRRQSNQ